ncbi:T9SS type A sorting domain-containing protein [Polaribacter sp. IC063]|uniref:T9SS type A sorting domain-containing protein n=1 Tax=Polaribacter sp. IC063 TaxID=57031 RepID=UPI0011BEF911|nr:T9SS type A sorting domain-containing protein [Polaribacter sp. IC063]TXD54225.1 T9SS type A sorting domain-containing protein [Polaribacter sp. IC063]
MKKNYIFTLLLMFSLISTSFGQELLLNGGLENWDSDTEPTDWTKVEETTKESTEIHGGSFSAKHVGGTKDLGQTIAGVVAGDSYTITIWYKVVESDGSDARIWSYWKDDANTSVTDATTDDALRGPADGYLDNNGGAWSKYEVTVTAPTGATRFYFELRTYSGAITYWDDLSFFKNTTASLKENTIEGFTTYPNPVTNNIFTIKSNSSETKEVSIFNVLGKRVLSSRFSGIQSNVDVSSISAGLYILKVTEGTKTATSKLVIR